jgi:hypothetical protein
VVVLEWPWLLAQVKVTSLVTFSQHTAYERRWAPSWRETACQRAAADILRLKSLARMPRSHIALLLLPVQTQSGSWCHVSLHTASSADRVRRAKSA